MLVIRPKKSPIIFVLVATSLMWGAGAIVIFQSPANYTGYLAVCLGLSIVAYVGTQRVVVTGKSIEFYRFFIKYAEAGLSDVLVEKRLVGNPPLIPGYAFIRPSDKRTIAELPGGFSRADIDELKRHLSTHSCR